MAKARFSSKHLASYLKMDAFGQKQSVRLAGEESSITVISRPVFFQEIYVPIKNNTIKIHDGTTEVYVPVDYDDWIEDLKENIDSVVVYIEGYAGCGKSVFVQKILTEFFPNLDYDRNYYDYDIGAVYNVSDRKRIRDAIVECFIRTFLNVIKEGKFDLIHKFEELLSSEAVLNLDNDSEIEYLILSSKEYKKCIEQLKISIDEYKLRELKNVLHIQLQKIGTDQALYLDSIFRIARYITTDTEPETLIVCYDNLDAIENNDELCEFDNVLGSVRENIDKYLKELPKEIFNKKAAPHFVYLATFRKITAVRVGLYEELERAGDNYDQRQHIYYIEGSQLYDFQKMVQKRYDYFESFCKLMTIEEEGKKLLTKLKKAKEISQTRFVQNRYAGLWNNNYRTCCDIMEIIIDNYEQEVDLCLGLVKQHIDGYNDRLNVAMGASAVFLSIICKVQKIKNYWSEGHLNLTRLSKGDDIPSAEQILEDQSKITELTSPSRLILTYIRNVSILESRSVSVCELGNVFGKVYSISIITSCLANMLYREDHGLWRRPIIFSNNAVRSSENIADALSLQLMNSLQKHPDRMTYSEITVCDCGDAFINRVSCDFEYYAIRLGYNTSMYLIHDSGEIQQIIDDVYSAVEACCKKMKVFAAVYKHKYMIDNKKMYNELRIHPLTYKGSTQLHTERVIFNHIEYLDIFRIYVARNQGKYNGDIDLRELLLKSMKRYIELYQKHIKPLDERRSGIAVQLNDKIQYLLKNINDNETRVNRS